LVGIKLDKYPAFVEIVWKLIRGGFSRSILKQISKGSYRALIPASLVALVEAQLKRVSSETLDSIATPLLRRPDASVKHIRKNMTGLLKRSFPLLEPLLMHRSSNLL